MPDQRIIQQWQAKEGLPLPDELVAQLPVLSRNHPKRDYWELQGYALIRLAARIRILPYQLSILMVSCSNGWASNYLANLEKTTVVEANFITANQAQAQRVFGEGGNPDYQLADIFRDVINPSSFDLVVLFGVAEFYPDVGKLLGQALEFLKPRGEVHLLGSPFWELGRIPNARKAQEERFEQIPLPQMKEHYFFHSVEEMTALGAHQLYNPYNRSGRLKIRVQRGKDSPFPWWMLPESNE